MTKDDTLAAMITVSSSTPLDGRHALVCGSTQGIGKAGAMALAAAGAQVTLIARNDQGLEKVRAELPAARAQAHRVIVADFTDWKSLQEKVQTHLQQHGPAHILVNNTGGPPAGPAFEAQPDEYTRAFNQHLLCNQALVQAVAAGMREAKYGRIINIISTSVIMPIKGLGVSNTIRAAVANWARTLAVELAPFGITVNNVLPGYTATARLGSLIQGRASRAGAKPEEIEREMMASVPMRRFGTPEEIGAVIAFLASPAASYVTGVNLPVDGGRLAGQ
jgi:3-oxoacyl-[acyl-carrier protein] reductase